MAFAGQMYELDLSMLCKAKGTSFAELGRKLKPPVTRAAVSRWANGDRPMPPGIIRQIAAILNESEELVAHCVEVGIARHTQHREK